MSNAKRIRHCGLRRAGHVDGEAEAERGEGGFDLFHTRGVAQVEDAGDLRQVPAQPTGKLGTADALSRIASYIAAFAIPKADSGSINRLDGESRGRPISPRHEPTIAGKP